MTYLAEQITDMQQSLISLDEKVTTEETLAISKISYSEETDAESKLWLLIYMLGAVVSMTWIFFCCFCCYLRSRSAVEKRQFEVIERGMRSNVQNVASQPQVDHDMELRERNNSVSRLMPLAGQQAVNTHAAPLAMMSRLQKSNMGDDVAEGNLQFVDN